jgi:hypothetical protein
MRPSAIQAIIFIPMLLSFGSVSAQLDPEELKQDVSQLRAGLQKYHPGLYWYTSESEFDSAWDSLIAELDHPMTDDEFLKLLLPVVAKVKCAHTLFYPSKELMSRGKRFPLNLKFINGKAYVFSDSSFSHGIPNGSEVLTINGRPMRDVIKTLLPNLEAQGGNAGWKYVILDGDFQNYYHYAIENADQFVIEYLNDSTERSDTATLAGSSDPKRRSHWSNWYPEKDGAPLKIDFARDSGTAIITIKSLSKGRYKMYDQDFDKLLEQYFQQIRTRNIKGLILDLRGNEGGNNPEKVYSYIARNGDRNTNASRDLISPNKLAFTGSVIVLMNERSISAQESFVAIFKNNNRGLTIGRPTPGSYDGLCSGNKRKIILKNSNFEIRIPLHASYRSYLTPTNYKQGVGIPPDIEVDETIEDILAGIDLPMEVALDRIKDKVQ